MHDNDKYFEKLKRNRDKEKLKKIVIRNVLALIGFTLIFVFSDESQFFLIGVALLCLVSIYAAYKFINQYKMLKSKNKVKIPDIKKLLLIDKPDALIEVYNKNSDLFRDVKADNLEIYLEFNKAYIYCLYGEFEKANELIDRINWSDQIPYFQAMRYVIIVLENYLKPISLREGLRYSLLVQNNAHIENDNEEIRKENMLRESYIEIGKLLCEDIDIHLIDKLEEKFAWSPVYIKLIIAWGLSSVYNRLGDLPKRDEKLAYIKETAPFCVPLRNLV